MDRLWAMEVFARVAESGSFSRAAISLNVSKATVTTCVRNLEQHLGAPLIHRHTRRVQLTEEGAVYLTRVRDVLQSVAHSEDEIRLHLGELTGSLHVECPISIGHALLCPALGRFAQRYPDISTSITLTNQRHNLIERAIDVAIRIDTVEDASLVARPVYEARYMVCCTPQLHARLPVSPADLDPRLCMGILPGERRYPVPWRLQRGEEQLIIQPAGALHFNSSDALLESALNDSGVVYVLDVFARRYLQSGHPKRCWRALLMSNVWRSACRALRWMAAMSKGIILAPWSWPSGPSRSVFGAS